MKLLDAFRLLVVLSTCWGAWLAASCRAEDAPWYDDRAHLLCYQDEQGNLLPVRTADEWQRRVAHVRAGMEAVMGPLPKKTQLPLDLIIHGETRLRHYTRQHVSFVVEPGDRLPGYLLVPHEAADWQAGTPGLPAMICLPGSSAPGKLTPAGLSSSGGLAYGHELAERGFVCLVLDYPMLHTAEYSTDPYELGYVSATMKGIVNHRRGVDLLESLPYVDARAIGVIGHSLGGHNALFLAVFEPRIQAVVSSCGFNVFAKHAGGDVRAWSNPYYMPRIKTIYEDDPAKIPFDFTEVLAALAPRPVFVNAPLHDAPDFEVSGVVDCVVAALPVYRELFQAADRLEVVHPDAGHSFPFGARLAAYAMLDRYLRLSADNDAREEEAIDLRRGLYAHWPLRGNVEDHSRFEHAGRVHGAVDWAVAGPNGRPRGAAGFLGRDGWLEVPPGRAPQLGTSDFTFALWLHTQERMDDIPGDILSQYDPAKKRGFHLSLKTNAGVTSSQPNFRHLHFGIDDGHESEWIDCGRPGNALLAFALAVHEGALYAGTCEPGKEESGRVYRYAGNQQWIDCGAPDKSNSVTALAVYRGELYAATGKYRVAGSALPESENEHLGGGVFRYAARDRWIHCGNLPDTEAVGGLVVFRDELYASSLYRPAGFYRFDGQSGWIDCGTPDEKRVEALGVFNGYIYATSYDGGRVYRYDGQQWTDCGQLGDNTQTYSFAVHEGRLYVGTWPSGRVYRFEDIDQWTDVGRLGEELEVMGMLVHNGRLIAGTLPLAEVYSYEGGMNWQRLARLDHTPDVRYRRAWTMAEHDGQLFCSTLPSGKVFAYEAGKNVLWGQPLAPGWHHLTAVKGDGRLTLYVDGRQVARSPRFDTARFDLSSDAPLRIGAGTNDVLRGRMADVRLYRRILGPDEIRLLASPETLDADRGSAP
jgi:dienelactone hydrolase